MLDLYDKALIENLESSLGPSRVYAPEKFEECLAMLKSDHIDLPAAFLSRESPSIDKQRLNFTLQHQGIPIGMNPKTNKYIWERRIPVDLRYILYTIAGSQRDLDDLTRELMFKYLYEYFIPIKIPLGIDRWLRFGVVFDFGEIKQTTSTADYLQSGKLYQAEIPIIVHGANLFDAVEVPFTRVMHDTKIGIKKPKIKLEETN